jgi:putative peptidoglycan lipid II flippase
VKVLAPGFFAHRNTATPVKVAVAAMVLNLLLTVGLMQVWGHVGVALALSGSGWMQALTLLVLLRRHGHLRLDRRVARNLPRIAAAALAMAAMLWGLCHVLAPALAGPPMLKLAALAGLIVAGAAVFAALILALGVTDWRELRGQLRRQPA